MLDQSRSLSFVRARGQSNGSSRAAWLFSWPLLMGVWVYIYFFFRGSVILNDGDTFGHIATGKWILQHGAVPTVDPFSHTMRGAPWTASEWLSQVVLAVAHELGGWTLVVSLTTLAFAATVALLTRALLRCLEPIHALLFAMLAVAMTAGHVLARPHMLAMPLLLVWSIELVHASEEGRSPSLWLLPLMTLWANLHGGFTLGIALACAMSLEAALGVRQQQRLRETVRSWGLFLVLAVLSALITPNGTQGFWFTWDVMFGGSHSYALDRIGEWRSPDFHTIQPLEVWVLGALALAMHQGLRLPAIRLCVLLALIHLSLKHIRNVELVGLLAPVFVAAPLAMQWRQAQVGKQQLESADRFFGSLAQPAGAAALVASFAILVFANVWMTRYRPIEPPELSAPVLALRAARQAHVTGPVLNRYSWGGYLIYSGIAPFIDGRSDLYRDEFIKEFVAASDCQRADSLEHLLGKYKIEWTLLPPDSAAVAMLEHLPGWSRIYADETAVIHVRSRGANRQGGAS